MHRAYITNVRCVQKVAFLNKVKFQIYNGIGAEGTEQNKPREREWGNGASSKTRAVLSSPPVSGPPAPGGTEAPGKPTDY